MTVLGNGPFTVGRWNTRNGPERITTVDGETDYGDTGMPPDGSCTGEVREPGATGTPPDAPCGVCRETAVGRAVHSSSPASKYSSAPVVTVTGNSW